MARSKSELRNIAAEGFAMLDEIQYIHNYQQPKRHVYQVIIPVAQAKEEVVSIDSYQAAQLYGGTLIAEYRKSTKKPLMRMPKFYK